MKAVGTINVLILVFLVSYDVDAQNVPPRFPSSNSNMRMSASPEDINIGLNPTTDLQVMCEYTGGKPVRSLGIGRKCSGEKGRILATKTKDIKEVILSAEIPDNAVVTYDLNAEIPFIAIGIDSPKAEDSCVYDCNAKIKKGVSFWGYIFIGTIIEPTLEIASSILSLNARSSIITQKLENIRLIVDRAVPECSQTPVDELCGNNSVCIDTFPGFNCECASGFLKNDTMNCVAGVSGMATFPGIDVSDKNLTEGSDDFNSIKRRFETALEKSLSESVMGLESVVIRSITSGSLMIEFDMLFDSSVNSDYQSASATALGEISESGLEVNGTVLPVSVVVVIPPILPEPPIATVEPATATPVAQTTTITPIDPEAPNTPDTSVSPEFITTADMLTIQETTATEEITSQITTVVETDTSAQDTTLSPTTQSDMPTIVEITTMPDITSTLPTVITEELTTFEVIPTTTELITEDSPTTTVGILTTTEMTPPEELTTTEEITTSTKMITTSESTASAPTTTPFAESEKNKDIPCDGCDPSCEDYSEEYYDDYCAGFNFFDF